MVTEFDRVVLGRYRNFLPYSRVSASSLETGGVVTPPPTGGGSVSMAGVPVIVRPDSDGTWPEVDRPEGAVLWWQRPIDSTTNASIPTFREGYEMGDLVSPPPDASSGEALPFLGTVWSDSMAVGSSGTLAGRTTDNYAGGVGPHQWGGSKGSGTAFPRTRVMSDLGLECADTGTAFITSPPVSLSGDYRVSWNANAATTSNYGGVVLTGASLSSRLTALWLRGTTNDSTSQVRVSIAHWEPEKWQPEIILGFVPAARWDRITVTRRGLDVIVDFAGQRLTHTLTGEAATHPRQFGFYAGLWGTFSAKNITFEAI